MEKETENTAKEWKLVSCSILTILFSSSWSIPTVNRRIDNRVVVSILLGITVLSTLPLHVLFVNGSTTSSPYPVLRAGDYWNFQYSTGETSHETISNDTCGGTSCINDSELSAPWSDITWRNADWSIIK